MIIKPGFYKTRNGKKAEVFAIRDGRAYGMLPGEGISVKWTVNGRYYEDGFEGSLDLLSEWVEPTCVEWWEYITPQGFTSSVGRKIESGEWDDRIICRHLRWDGKTVTDVTEE